MAPSDTRMLWKPNHPLVAPFYHSNLEPESSSENPLRIAQDLRCANGIIRSAFYSVIYQNSRGFHGDLLILIDFHGFAWISMDCHGFHGCSLIIMDLHAISMDFHGFH